MTSKDCPVCTVKGLVMMFFTEQIKSVVDSKEVSMSKARSVWYCILSKGMEIFLYLKTSFH